MSQSSQFILPVSFSKQIGGRNPTGVRPGMRNSYGVRIPRENDRLKLEKIYAKRIAREQNEFIKEQRRQRQRIIDNFFPL
jgi:hypothetical protein